MMTGVTISGTNGGSSFQNEIATLQSPPFSLIAAQTLKPSQNLYTELILRTLGKVTPPPATTSILGQTSEDLGLIAVKSFLKSAGIQPEALNLDDGSGLSRNDMITADASVQLLAFMSKHRYAATFRDALPIAGVDGTLRNRMRGTPAENNVRAKTGSLSQPRASPVTSRPRPARSSRFRSSSTITREISIHVRCASTRLPSCLHLSPASPNKKMFSRKGATAQRKTLETRQRFASLRLCARKISSSS